MKCFTCETEMIEFIVDDLNHFDSRRKNNA